MSLVTFLVTKTTLCQQKLAGYFWWGQRWRHCWRNTY